MTVNSELANKIATEVIKMTEHVRGILHRAAIDEQPQLVIRVDLETMHRLRAYPPLWQGSYMSFDLDNPRLVRFMGYPMYPCDGMREQFKIGWEFDFAVLRYKDVANGF